MAVRARQPTRRTTKRTSVDVKATSQTDERANPRAETGLFGRVATVALRKPSSARGEETRVASGHRSREKSRERTPIPRKDSRAGTDPAKESLEKTRSTHLFSVPAALCLVRGSP